MKHTKILCTVGPASSSKKVLRKMIDNGMNAVRINTAHGDFVQYSKTIKRIKEIADIPIVIDIKGPELRIRLVEERNVYRGKELEIGFSSKFPCRFSANCYNDMKKGDKLLIKDGTIQAKVVGKKNNAVTVKFSKTAVLKNNSNVTVVGKELNVPSLSAKDKKAVKFAIKKKADFIALSYTRNQNDVNRLRDLLGNSGIGIIAKIESESGIHNFNEILDASDGIMVARGDLGVTLPLQKVPMIQKELIKRCNQKGKLVITATQMLESMIDNARPTRAEASDVANAILDGTDAIMLSGETAIGKYPVGAVSIMTSIARDVEKHVTNNVESAFYHNLSDAITKSVYELANAVHIDEIVTITHSGYTARMMSRFRVNKMIIAVTISPIIKRQLELYYGVYPVVLNIPKQGRILFTALELVKKKLLDHNDCVVFTAGVSTTKPLISNLIEVHTISELFAYNRSKKK